MFRHTLTVILTVLDRNEVRVRAVVVLLQLQVQVCLVRAAVREHLVPRSRPLQVYNLLDRLDLVHAGLEQFISREREGA